MSKINVAVIMGGYSSEYEISVQSGALVCQYLKNTDYNIYPIYITKERWFFLDKNNCKNEINKADFSFNDHGNIIKPNIIFNTIHGTPGEDGYLASYFELLGIPQTSTSFYQAALSFNKRDCLSVLKNFNISCAPSFYINKGQSFSTSEIINKVGLPCFVKPNRAGSSFGISKVNKAEEMEEAIKIAFKEDTELLIETALVGVEVSIGVFKDKGELVVLPPTEIVPENDFFDYEAKYLGKSQEITPARISKQDTERVQLEAKKIYQLLNMKGVTRTDFIIENGTPFFIETNTTPGLSKESIIPKQIKEYGITLSDFFKILIEEALYSH